MSHQSQGFVKELKDAVSGRSALLVVAVLLLQLAFITSYVGALHEPKPHHLSIGVVAPAQQQAQVVGALDQVPGEAVRATAVADEATAVARIKDQKLYAALIVDPSGSQDTLLVAGARGKSAATAAQSIVTQLEQHQGRTVQTKDVIPLPPGDANGLTSFYLVIGWCVGGYLVASILGISAGSRPANRDRALIRTGVLALYSIAAGLGGALIVGPILNALPGSTAGLWGVGSLVVFAVGTVTMALECLFDLVGIGLAVLLFVVLGNPSAGGVYPPPLMPPFWRAIGAWLPNGAGTDATRSIAYFGATNLTVPLLVLAAWAVLGMAVTLVAVSTRPRGGREMTAPSEPGTTTAG
ncbi:DUF3533 domain-containing protein [Kitasatospora sp. NBC_01250]|uniref:DUF3533 domain-containing protein n=1 Tax=unclassified Kitasatospora TaxID=2633591 RepID=UPI002E1572DC|nr:MULTISPECIES: DUF3533 domain-containing protein [unclassified Kitasatospora]WSJ69240.1 DUF3533 domain-containing protein [Kitasatospora sp. NBC_01302]